MLSTACIVLGAVALAGQTPQRPGQLPMLPLTQLDDRVLAADLDNRTFTLTFAQPVSIRDLLLLLVRGTTLSVIPDPSIGGSFIGELKNVTVRQALGLILPPLGLDYTVDAAFIRVFRREPETRLFDINYIATERTGTASLGDGPITGGSYARVSSTTRTDLFAEVTKGVQTLVSEHATFNVDRKAGLLQVTDFPERLDRVAVYLDTVHDHVHRQVQIDARVIEVELSDANARSLDWTALAQGGGEATGGPGASRPMLNGLRVTDLSRFMAALATQGKVSVLANPRLLALNNEPAVVRAASHVSGTREGDRQRDDEGVTLGVTPQIAGEGVVMLSLSPIVSVHSADGDDKTPVVTAIGETDTLARVGDGETIVVAGFTREVQIRERKNVGLKGRWFGRATVVTRKRVELLILLTPKILTAIGPQ